LQLTVFFVFKERAKFRQRDVLFLPHLPSQVTRLCCLSLVGRQVLTNHPTPFTEDNSPTSSGGGYLRLKPRFGDSINTLSPQSAHNSTLREVRYFATPCNLDIKRRQNPHHSPRQALIIQDLPLQVTAAKQPAANPLRFGRWRPANWPVDQQEAVNHLGPAKAVKTTSNSYQLHPLGRFPRFHTRQPDPSFWGRLRCETKPKPSCKPNPHSSLATPTPTCQPDLVLPSPLLQLSAPSGYVTEALRLRDIPFQIFKTPKRRQTPFVHAPASWVQEPSDFAATIWAVCDQNATIPNKLHPPTSWPAKVCRVRLRLQRPPRFSLLWYTLLLHSQLIQQFQAFGK